MQKINITITKQEGRMRGRKLVRKYPVPVLKAKMKTLMGSYRSEKLRENKSRVTGSGK
nr:unnamed protein product [Callosobruchus chinensis]